MYSLVVLLEPDRDLAVPARLHRRRARRRGAGRCCSGSRSRRMLYTHNWALFLGAGDGPRLARPAVPGARRRAPRAAASTARSASARRAAVPALAADAAVPGRAHRRAVVAQARATSRSRWRRRTGCSATPRGSCWWSPRAAASSRSSRPAAAGDLTARGPRRARRRRRSAVGTVLLAWTSSQFSPGVGDALPRDRRPAVPAARRRRARPRARDRRRSALVHRRDPVGLRRVAERRRATSAPVAHGDRAEPRARRRRRLHPARAGAGAAPLPAAGPALRDADRLRRRTSA